MNMLRDMITGNDLELVRAKLTDIDEIINDTAVDVFVYDTSKDSDGGAWRHRTQHTSWYAEASSATRDVNTRSTRAEFPAVAVIVAEANKVTIYDGDDPSLPMWMVFNEGNFNNLVFGFNSLSAKNGILCSGNNEGNVNYVGLMVVRFLNDDLIGVRNWTYPKNHASISGVVNRNSAWPQAGSRGLIISGGGLVSALANDVAMTVLPDAPTDPATGLPVPTIAVATDGGVSVIKDDGNVWDDAGGAAKAIHINDGGSLFYSETGSTFMRYKRDIGSISADFSSDGDYSNVTTPAILVNNLPDQRFAGDATTSGNVGLTHLDEDPTTPANGMVAYTTSSYATGWMNGDIKLAALADTTAETLSGSELVTNGDFATDTDWTDVPNGSSGGTIEISSGTLNITQGSNSVWMGAVQQITIPAGAKYLTLTAERTSVSSSAQSNVGFASASLFPGGSGSYGAVTWNTIETGQKTVTVAVADLPSPCYVFVNDGGAANIATSFDNISVRLADPDRSVNGNGLAVHGSITKAPVATGADVVAYSGFSGSNYLEQPYNSDLDFGTGDFCVMGWVNFSGSAYAGIAALSSERNSASNPGFSVYYNPTNLYFRVSSTEVLPTSLPPTGQWVHVCAVRTDGDNTGRIYINGQLNASSTSMGTSSSPTNNSATLVVGGYWSGAGLIANSAEKYALIRISATAPTADQIRKIYEDEKVLFQPNAKATLTGNSDAVTALAHDPDTNLLHVGTSGGRSVFQGLRRVDETATAVTTAISAVDGLVVEQ